MNIKNETRWLIIICLVAFAVFANGLSGDFVYDDNRQILRNPLIQDSTFYGKALTSDVWAFKGDGTIAASNYYRPTFISWLILNFTLFGTNPFGWHLLNLLLHIGVCALGYLLLQRWNVENYVAFAISLIFAVHPVHAESVVWISGSPDLLFAIFLLASFWFAENYTNKTQEKTNFFNRLDLPLALIFYAFALGSKEVGILCFPLFYFIFKKNQTDFKDKNPRVSPSPFLLVVPFAVLAILYFAARWLVIGAISLPPEDGGSPFYQAILSVPAMFVFYLRQILFPFGLGANYPLRTVSEFGLLVFILPLIISVAAIALFWLLAKKSFVQKFGFALFILTLAPAMNASAFHSEQIVHDRYLYLPLFGFLIMVFPYIGGIIERFAKDKKQIVVVIVAIIIALPLFLKTVSYNSVWKNELSLWTNAVTIDKNSAFNWSQYASVLSENNKIDEAVEAYNNSLDIRPSANAYYGRARNLLAQNKFEEAIFDCKTVIEMPNEQLNAYTLYQTYELIALIYAQQKQFGEAQKYLFDARKRLPIYYAALTEKLAVVMYQANEKTSALRELESVENQAKIELLPESKRVLLRLGMLYAEMNRKDEAKAKLTEYLRLTSKMQDKNTLQDRIAAVNLLKTL